MKTIAKIYTDFKEKFGIPRQSGIVNTLGKIVFEEEYRRPEALRGIDGYSHLWLIWNFSMSERDSWSPTVRPPRLGGNTRVGVFATRSPFRPNPIGLSSVKLIAVEKTKNEGTVLVVEGADILDGTPIYDIKPYLPYTDAHPDASAGFAGEVVGYSIDVEIPEEYGSLLTKEKKEQLEGVLAHDPRPSYKDDPDYEYGMIFGDYDVFFKADEKKLSVTKIIKRNLR